MRGLIVFVVISLFFNTCAISQYNFADSIYCATDKSFMVLDWHEPSGNFTLPFPTSYKCNSPVQRIWKAPQLDGQSYTRGQSLTGFQLEIPINITYGANTSVLVYVNGTPYSYYGPAPAPPNVLDWGAMNGVLSTTQLIFEPALPIGADIKLEFCDKRTTPQPIKYYFYDYSVNKIVDSNTVMVSQGNCVTVDYVLSQPTIKWDLDGDPTKLVDKLDGSATFDPSTLSIGNHVINYYFKNEAGCELTASQNFTIQPLIEPTFNSLSICKKSNPPSLPSTSANGISGTWNTTINTDVVGKFKFEFTPTDGQCADSTTFTVSIIDSITPLFTPFDTLCLNAAAPVMPLHSTNSITGTWTPQITTSSVGESTYTFKPNANQCALDKVITLAVKEAPVANAIPSITSGNPILSVDFENMSSHELSLKWDFGNGETSTSISNQSTSYTQVGDYNVTLTASSNFCPDNVWSVIIHVKPFDSLEVKIPNAFTPNGDGVNDYYAFELKNAAAFDGLIFNRWGNEIYSLKNPTDKWDGKSKSGKLVEDGVYFIKYKIEGLDKTIKEGTTFFHLE